MRYEKNLKTAFGEPDDDFKNNVYQTLSALPKGEERRPIRKAGFRLSVIIVISVFAVITTIACAMALTNTWGILDFINNRRYNAGAEVSPENIARIEKDVAQGVANTELAGFKVREGIFDGENIYIVVEVKPASPDYLLLGFDAMPYSPVGNLGPQFEGKTGSIADYAGIYNKTLIHTYISGLKALPLHGGDATHKVDIEELSGYSCDHILEDGGTLVYMFNGRYSAPQKATLELQLTCLTTTFTGNDFSLKDTQSTELFFTLRNQNN